MACASRRYQRTERFQSPSLAAASRALGRVAPDSRGVAFVVLEMEDTAGECASGRNESNGVSVWAAPLAVPGPRATLVQICSRGSGVLETDGWNERYLCQALQKRLFLHG